jgi:hypothetical protein
MHHHHPHISSPLRPPHTHSQTVTHARAFTSLVSAASADHGP